MSRNTLVGLLGILGIWATAGIALPFVNVLTDVSPEQLLAVRGGLTAVLAGAMLRGKVRGVDRWTYLIIPCVAFASLGLFKGIRAWGAGPTLIVVAATPLVNFGIALCKGKKISTVTVAALILLLDGVTRALWGGGFSGEGFAWSIFGTVMNAFLYEAFARSKAGLLQQCFWASIGIAGVGIFGSVGQSWQPLQEPIFALKLVAFAFVGGFLYWMANILAFSKKRLPTEVASVLAQGETPAVIAMAGIILGETLSMFQWIGVGIALYGAWMLVTWIKRKEPSLEAA